MKLWLLEPTDTSEAHKVWSPWYDKVHAIVVRAETEADARTIATANGADEIANNENAWLDAELSTCVELTAVGEPGLIISDVMRA